MYAKRYTRRDASTREDDPTSNKLSFFLRLTQKLYRYELKCVVCIVMESEGEGGVSGRDKLCMCLILCVFLYVCVCVGGEGVTSYFTQLDNFDKQRFLNKR